MQALKPATSPRGRGCACGNETEGGDVGTGTASTETDRTPARWDCTHLADLVCGEERVCRLALQVDAVRLPKGLEVEAADAQEQIFAT
jgi:hypothetical protein